MRDPGEKNPVFLPSDSWFEWLLAKIYYRCGDAQVCLIMHVCIVHMFCTFMYYSNSITLAIMYRART